MFISYFIGQQSIDYHKFNLDMSEQQVFMIYILLNVESTDL